MTSDWQDIVPSPVPLVLHLTDERFLLHCCVIGVFLCLSLWRRWAQLMDRPWLFALCYSLPFFFFTFDQSLGDSKEVMGYIGKRYYMSEPLATFLHHWTHRLFSPAFGLSPKTSIALTSRIAGSLYLWVTALVSFYACPGADVRRRLLFRLFFFVAGSSLLFYGYVENTPVAMPAEQAWVLATMVLLGAPSARNHILCGAVLAGATLAHGRVGFLAPALALGCMIPHDSAKERYKSLFIGLLAFVGTLALVVSAILLFDREGITERPWGNILGGGNLRQFISLSQLLTGSHAHMVALSLWLGAGLQAPVALLRIPSLLGKSPGPMLLWGLAYAFSGCLFVIIWEFDYGFFNDWDLCFSGAGGLLFLTALILTESSLPNFLLLVILACSAVLSLTFGSAVNGSPLSLT